MITLNPSHIIGENYFCSLSFTRAIVMLRNSVELSARLLYATRALLLSTLVSVKVSRMCVLAL